MTFTPTMLETLQQKARRSPSHIHIAAIALDKKGDILGSCSNTFRRDSITPGKYCGLHAEAKLIGRYKTNIKSLIILRIGHGGALLPVDPCKHCRKMAKKYGIKIVSVFPGIDSAGRLDVDY